MCSQSPSDANIRNLSFGRRTLEQIDGSEVSTGRRMGSGRWNRGNDGSRENSGFFKYASPIDLDTYYPHIKRNSREEHNEKSIKNKTEVKANISHKTQ